MLLHMSLFGFPVTLTLTEHEGSYKPYSIHFSWPDQQTRDKWESVSPNMEIDHLLPPAQDPEGLPLTERLSLEDIQYCERRPGLTMFVGLGGSGKTTLMTGDFNRIYDSFSSAQTIRPTYIKFAERGLFALQDIRDLYVIIVDELCERLNNTWSDITTTLPFGELTAPIFIDSLSKYVYMQNGGGTLEKGLSSNALFGLTELDQIARLMGTPITASLAPFVLADQSREMIAKQMVLQRVSHVLFLTAVGVGEWSSISLPDRSWRQVSIGLPTGLSPVERKACVERDIHLDASLPSLFPSELYSTTLVERIKK